jgi:NADPH:quinone reductase-like Zn-dependent oxidoreductase
VKAILRRRYGPPEVLSLEEVAAPAAAEDEVLVAVRAAALNPIDWHFMRGEPYFMRLASGLRTPKDPRLGADFAGVVDTVGRNVTRFRPGDAVFGTIPTYGGGALAERALGSEASLAAKPANVTFEEAAAAPVAALTALQGLRKGGIARGHRVLVNAAAGGVGTFVVQIAKALGAHVTGVCSTRNVELVRSIGAEAVVDYTREDFTAGEAKYDLIYDCIGNHPMSECRRVLAPTGVVVMIGGGKGRWVGPLPGVLASFATAAFIGQRYLIFLAKPNRDDIATIAGFLADGRVKSVIDRRYPLAEAAEAIRYLETGHARGKVVITV